MKIREGRSPNPPGGVKSLQVGRIGVSASKGGRLPEDRETLSSVGQDTSGQAPSLSIEVTRKCPLRCSGCYAYDDNHLGGETTLLELRDRKGEALIDGVMEIVDRRRGSARSISGDGAAGPADSG